LHGDLEAIWQRNRNSGVRSLPKISGNWDRKKLSENHYH
jgi:hypothetical protein